MPLFESLVFTISYISFTQWKMRFVSFTYISTYIVYLDLTYFQVSNVIQFHLFQDVKFTFFTLQGGDHDRDGVLNHRRLDCLLNRLSRRRSKKTSKLCITGLSEENTAVNSGLSAQRTRNAEYVFIQGHHHVFTSSDWFIPQKDWSLIQYKDVISPV